MYSQNADASEIPTTEAKTAEFFLLKENSFKKTAEKWWISIPPSGLPRPDDGDTKGQDVGVRPPHVETRPGAGWQRKRGWNGGCPG